MDRPVFVGLPPDAAMAALAAEATTLAAAEAMAASGSTAQTGLSALANARRDRRRPDPTEPGDDVS